MPTIIRATLAAAMAVFAALSFCATLHARQTVQAAQADVYAVTRNGFKTRYWKNGREVREFRFDGFSVGRSCQSGGDTYRSTPFAEGSRLAIQKNDSTIHYLTDGARAAYANSVFISGADVYAGGEEKDQRGAWVATVWKNGTVLHRLTDGSKDAAANALFVSGGDVYAGGREGNSEGRGVATVWKNGAVLHRLTNGARYATVKSLFVSDGDVYAGGWEADRARNSFATVWKNGEVLHRLNQDGATKAVVHSLFVQGADVYAAGFEGTTGKKGSAMVWKNGVVLYRLCDSDFDADHLVFVK